MITKLKDELEAITAFAPELVRKRLTTLLIMIKQVRKDQHHWEDFKTSYNAIEPDFFETLSAKHPSLTTKDLKYCCYLRMNLSNNEITRLMGVNQESVRTHKYRLKKKMALSKEQNLAHYLLGVNTRPAAVGA